MALPTAKPLGKSASGALFSFLHRIRTVATVGQRRPYPSPENTPRSGRKFLGLGTAKAVMVWQA